MATSKGPLLLLSAVLPRKWGETTLAPAVAAKNIRNAAHHDAPQILFLPEMMGTIETRSHYE